INSNKEKLKTADNGREQLYGQYEEIVKEISVLRSEFIKDVIGKDSNVKFDIQRRRNRSSFVQMMKSVLKRDNATIEDDINKLADIFFSDKGIEKFRQKIWEVREEKDKKSCSRYTCNAILEMQPESFARMISFLPEDDLKVSYRPENSKRYIPLSNASAGQKTTAILTFLLAYGELPLLLDQPEDDLDNKLVYDLIVTRLKETKSKRQVIVVTHNANIPVNADAEYIVSMNSETDEVATKYEGTMDDKNIRKEICDVMEGTQYAFEMRAKKYHFNIVE
ncbi:MAG: AAA family ATPase, partial [Lachnospiraceae bacterium]|nr:AAA family ATPase [Lachnospiraceae bacterium]